MKYEEPNMRILLDSEDIVRTSVEEGSGIPGGDYDKWPV